MIIFKLNTSECKLLFVSFVFISLFFGIGSNLLIGCSDENSSNPTATPTVTPSLTPTPLPNTPPETTITSGPTDIVTAFPVNFSFIGDDAEDETYQLTYSHRLDNSTWSSWQSETTSSYSGLSQGEHTFEVKARDSGGLEDETPASWDFTVYISDDEQAPETWIVSGPSGTIHSSECTFVFTGSDNETTTENLLFSYLFDDGSWSEYSTETSINYTGLSEGSHYFSVRAKDEAGNVDSSPDQRTFVVDLTYYEITLLPSYQEKTVAGGTEAVFIVSVKNTGTLTGTFTFGLTKNLPTDWGANFCLSSGECVVGTIDLTYDSGETDQMTIHIQTSSNGGTTQTGSVVLNATSLEDSTVSSQSKAQVQTN